VLAGERQRWKEDAAKNARQAEALAAMRLPAWMGRPLPAAKLMAAGDQPVPDETWRKDKVVLVLLTTGCDACRSEGAFLSKLIGVRRDVKFLGVLSFEQDEESLVAA
jgi:hypothetical protein